MRPFLEKYFANPSSGYRFAAQVREAIEQAREQVAALLGCEPGEIVFTSCGTESNNAAFHSALETRPDCKHVVTTASNTAQCANRRRNWSDAVTKSQSSVSI